MNLQQTGCAVSAAFLFAALAPAAQAQTFPVRPVQLIIPNTPGSSTDLIGRLLAQRLTETWKQPVPVENRGGGSTIIGTEAVARAQPDGHTLVVIAGNFTNNVTLFAGKLPYDTARDFAPITLINVTPLVLVVNGAVSIKSVQDLIAQAKARPGQMNFGSSSVGGPNHLSGELINFMAGVNIVHIPYKGNAPALTDLMAGRVDFVFNGTTSALPLIQAGRLRALGVSTRKRATSLPDVPTMDESGLKGFESAGWTGLVAPGKTPRAVIMKIHADTVNAIQSPEMAQRLKADGSEPGANTPDQFVAFLKEETEKWAKVIKFANIRPE